MSDYEVRLMREEDITDIIDLLNLVFEDWPDKDLQVSKKDHYIWKYLSRPKQDKLTSVAVHNNKVIACNHGFPVNIKMGDKTVKSNQATDFCVHPDFRRKGVSKIISEHKTEVFTKLSGALARI